MTKINRSSHVEPWDPIGARRKRVTAQEFADRALTVASFTIATLESVKVPLEELCLILIQHSNITLHDTPDDYPDLIWPLAQRLCDDYEADDIDEEHPLFGMTEVSNEN